MVANHIEVQIDVDKMSRIDMNLVTDTGMDKGLLEPGDRAGIGICKVASDCSLIGMNMF